MKAARLKKVSKRCAFAIHALARGRIPIQGPSQLPSRFMSFLYDFCASMDDKVDFLLLFHRRYHRSAVSCYIYVYEHVLINFLSSSDQ